MDSLARRGPGHGEYVAFRVAGQSFCVDIMTVREIRGWSAETRVPQAPAYMRGVTNLRGAILPTPDLACTAEDGFVCGLISMNGDLMSKVSVERLLFGGPGPTDLAAPVAV